MKKQGKQILLKECKVQKSGDNNGNIQVRCISLKKYVGRKVRLEVYLR